MSRYLQDKFVGKYRVLAEIDQSTNDYVRDETDNIDPSFDDLYIPCGKNSVISYMGNGKLQFYTLQKKRGNNIIDKLKKRNIELSNIQETDIEVSFEFKSNILDSIADILKPKTNGSSISPFSKKNLPKDYYEIPKNDFKKYQQIIQKKYANDTKIGIDGIKIMKINKLFYKHLAKSIPTIEKDRIKSCLGKKEYIHKIGKWEEYLEYLEKE